MTWDALQVEGGRPLTKEESIKAVQAQLEDKQELKAKVPRWVSSGGMLMRCPRRFKQKASWKPLASRRRSTRWRKSSSVSKPWRWRVLC